MGRGSASGCGPAAIRVVTALHARVVAANFADRTVIVYAALLATSRSIAADGTFRALVPDVHAAFPVAVAEICSIADYFIVTELTLIGVVRVTVSRPVTRIRIRAIRVGVIAARRSGGFVVRLARTRIRVVTACIGKAAIGHRLVAIRIRKTRAASVVLFIAKRRQGWLAGWRCLGIGYAVEVYVATVVPVAEDAVIARLTHAQLVVQTGSLAVARVPKVARRIVCTIATRRSDSLCLEQTRPVIGVACVVRTVIAVVAVCVFATLLAGGVTGTGETAEKTAGAIPVIVTHDATIILFVTNHGGGTWVVATADADHALLIAVAEQFIRARSEVRRMTRQADAVSIAGVRVRADRVRRIATGRTLGREPDYAGS